MRLIDADALIELYDMGEGLEEYAEVLRVPIPVIRQNIKDMPTIDAVPVVRCKDCKHWGGVVFGNVCRRWSAPLAGMRNDTKPDDFCAYGEQKDGDGNG